MFGGSLRVFECGRFVREKKEHRVSSAASTNSGSTPPPPDSKALELPAEGGLSELQLTGRTAVMPIHVVTDLRAEVPSHLKKVPIPQLSRSSAVLGTCVKGKVIKKYPLVSLEDDDYVLKTVIQEHEDQLSLPPGSTSINAILFGPLAKEFSKTVNQGDLVVMAGFVVGRSPTAQKDGLHPCNLQLAGVDACIYVYPSSSTGSSTSTISAMTPVPSAETTKPKYTYVSLKDLKAGMIVNIYGVVTFFKQPFRTKGTVNQNSVPRDPDHPNTERKQAASCRGTPAGPRMTSARAPTSQQGSNYGNLFREEAQGSRTVSERPLTPGYNYCSTLKITDQSDIKLGCTIFSEKLEDHPQIYKIGDIVRLHRVKAQFFNGSINMVSTLGFSVVTFDGTVGSPMIPRTCSRSFHFSDEDRHTVERLRAWAASQSALPSMSSALLSSVRPRMYFDLTCQLLAKAVMDSSCTLLRVWDGTRCAEPLLNVSVEPEALEGSTAITGGRDNLVANVLAYDNHVEVARGLKVRGHSGGVP
ncbi:hypothetical protein JZ751_009029 [Albula glossodonta]|uniref:Protection of telomeres protein 1 n=1 Tax=Albula glossodonta TaxID=121402 RepID=A0A8T2NXT2_9TELE|nr:hypothetical protein JZ751_009029 [Albula glossodonta]